jgi:hypothetical protein
MGEGGRIEMEGTIQELASFMASLTDEQLQFFEDYNNDKDEVPSIAAAIRAVKPMFAPEKPRRGRPRKATNGSGV